MSILLPSLALWHHISSVCTAGWCWSLDPRAHGKRGPRIFTSRRIAWMVRVAGHNVPYDELRINRSKICSSFLSCCLRTVLAIYRVVSPLHHFLSPLTPVGRGVESVKFQAHETSQPLFLFHSYASFIPTISGCCP